MDPSLDRQSIIAEEKILVVDDEQIIHEAIGKYLERLGFTLYHAYNGQEALELYHRIHPTLILLDLRMPVMDGIELLDRLKLSSADTCSVIAVTGHAGEEELEECFKRGILTFLRKPFSLYELNGVVANTIALQQANRRRVVEIKERKVIEEIQNRLIDDFQSIFESAPLGFVYLDDRFNIIKMNGFMYKFTGATPEEIIGKPCYDTVGEYAADPARTGHERLCSFCKKAEAFKTGNNTVIERPLGDKHIRVTTVPHRSRNGSIDHFLEVIEDITWQKNAEERIVRNYQIQNTINAILQISTETMPLQEVLQRVLELVLSVPRFSFQSKGSIHIVDKESMVLKLYAHHNYEKDQINNCTAIPFGSCLCGMAATTGKIVFADSIDHRHTILYGDITPHGHYCVPIIQGSTVLGVFSMYIPEGHTRNIEEEEFLMAIANTLANVIIRKQRNVALREREEHFRSVVQSTTNAIVTINSAGTIVLWNKAAEQIFGYTYEEAVGQPLTIIIPEQYREAHMRGLERVFLTGTTRITDDLIELTALKKDGTEFPVEFSIAKWSTSNGDFITAVLIDITKRKQTDESLQQSLDTLQKVLSAIIQTLSLAVEAKDPYTAGHQHRVADLSQAIAQEMHLPLDVVEAVRLAGAIHDLGKIWVPSEILSKPGRLLDIEYALIKNHSVVGYEILKNIDFPWPLDQIVLQHHERIDGSGYPYGLRGDDIMVEARIICVADVVEAMSTHRPYRPALGLEAALEEIQSNRGVFYDPDVVDACLRLFFEKNYRLPDTLHPTRYGPSKKSTFPIV